MSKKTRFCANCGKETNKLVDNLCSNCYIEAKEVKVPKRLIQKICSKCDAIFAQGVWIKSKKSLEANLNEKLKKKLKLPESEKLKAVEVDLKNSRARIKTSVLDKEFDLNQKVNIEIIKQLCFECRALSSKQHKIKIQLRFNKFSSALVEKALTFTKQKKKFIQKVEEYRNGLDIFMKNPGVANTLARKLAREFNCKMSRTVEQYGWNKQKNRPLHRHSILLRQV